MQEVRSRRNPPSGTPSIRLSFSIPSISLATVYKNIDVFVDHSMMRDITPNYGSRRIEVSFKPHDHFVCRNSRRVFDLSRHTELPPPPRNYLPSGSKFEYHLVELVGLCRECAEDLAGKEKSELAVNQGKQS